MTELLSDGRWRQRRNKQGGWADALLVTTDRGLRQRRSMPLAKALGRKHDRAIGRSLASSSSTTMEDTSQLRRQRIKRSVALVPVRDMKGAYSVQSTNHFSNDSAMPEGTIVLPNTVLLSGDADDSDDPSSGDGKHRHFHYDGPPPDQGAGLDHPNIVQIYSNGTAQVDQASDKTNSTFAGTSTPNKNNTDPASETVTSLYPSLSASMSSDASTYTTTISSGLASNTAVPDTSNDSGPPQPGPPHVNKIPIIVSVSVILVLTICLTVIFVLWARSKRDGDKLRGLPGLVSRWRTRRHRRKHGRGPEGVDRAGTDVEEEDEDLGSDIDEKDDDGDSRFGMPLSAASLTRRSVPQSQTLPSTFSRETTLDNDLDLDSRYSRIVATRPADLPAFPPAYRPSSASLLSTVRGSDIPHLNTKGLYRSSEPSNGLGASTSERSLRTWSASDSGTDDKEVLARLQAVSTAAPGFGAVPHVRLANGPTALDEASAPPLEEEDDDFRLSVHELERIQVNIPQGSTDGSTRDVLHAARANNICEKEAIANAEIALLPSDPFHDTAAHPGLELPRYMPKQVVLDASAPALDDDDDAYL